VSNLPTRKTFFAKLLGLIAAAGVLPRLAAKAAVPASGTTLIQVQRETRAVSRSERSV